MIFAAFEVLVTCFASPLTYYVLQLLHLFNFFKVDKMHSYANTNDVIV